MTVKDRAAKNSLGIYSHGAAGGSGRMSEVSEIKGSKKGASQGFVVVVLILEKVFNLVVLLSV